MAWRRLPGRGRADTLSPFPAPLGRPSGPPSHPTRGPRGPSRCDVSAEPRPIPGNLPVQPKKTYFRPTPEELRQFAAEMPNARETEFRVTCVVQSIVYVSAQSK